MANPIFVAPHYDDVALSCGGTVATRAIRQSPIIVTVFGGRPTGNLTDFAMDHHRTWKIGGADVVDVRRAEDECAARELGDSVRLSHLDFQDAIYRNAYYASNEALFGPLPEFDLRLSALIADALLGYDADEYFVPLGIGNHVDHQIVCRSGFRLIGRGKSVLYYTDLPYALKNSKIETHARRIGLQSSITVEFDSVQFEQKWAAIACYESQLDLIFQEISDPRTDFERFARRVGNGKLAELFWRDGATR